MADPGDYQFKLRVTLEGESGSQVLNISTNTFQPTADLRLLLLPWTNQFEGSPHAWDSALYLAIAPAMQQGHRKLSTTERYVHTTAPILQLAIPFGKKEAAQDAKDDQSAPAEQNGMGVRTAEIVAVGAE